MNDDVTATMHIGYLGITGQQCEDKGCCWSPKEVPTHFDAINCFYSMFL